MNEYRLMLNGQIYEEYIVSDTWLLNTCCVSVCAELQPWATIV
jgi:hypothetical protein